MTINERAPVYMVAEDLTVGILAMKHPSARNETFNAMTPNSTSALELAPLIWGKINGPNGPFPYVTETGFKHCVAWRTPSTAKAERVLGFRATMTLDEMLDEVIPWIANAIEEGLT